MIAQTGYAESNTYVMLKAKQQTANGVTYAKPHITKLRFKLITLSALPEMES